LILGKGKKHILYVQYCGVAKVARHGVARRWLRRFENSGKEEYSKQGYKN
jgi:hypothetical protein